MGVVEGRQIAFDEAQRLRAMPWQELISQPRKRREPVRGGSGRAYLMKIEFDHSETGLEYGDPMTHGTVLVRGEGRLSRIVSFGEGVSVAKNPEMNLEVEKFEPTSVSGEFQKRIKLAVLIPLIPILILFVVIALPFFLTWVWASERFGRNQ